MGRFGAVLRPAAKTAAAPRYSICTQCGEQNQNAPPESGEFWMTERTSVLTVKARRSGAPALEARAVLRPAVRRLGAVALGFAGGWAVLYGALMPFGLGLVLGLAEDCFAPVSYTHLRAHET